MAFDPSSAVLVRHATADIGGARPIRAAGGGVAANLSLALDYTSRTNQFEEKGGCDRELTPEDHDLMRLNQDLPVGRALDYVSREGRWEHKGEGRQVDCSFFGQHGAVAREEVEQDMMRCGGCYMRSVVSVRREDAAMLGLDDKAGWERLLRITWAESVADMEGSPGWGVTDDPVDVHWVANFHTDAENSLHCHVLTWFANGERDFNREGWLASASGSRSQRERIYAQAYERPMREEVYPAKEYARALALAAVRAELGIKPTESQVSAFERAAVAAGYEPRLPGRSIEGSAADTVAKRVSVMREEYARGSGRKSSNYRLGAAARDVHKALLENSEAYAEAVELYREQIEKQADAKALCVNAPDDGQERSTDEVSAREVVGHLRDRFVREQMEELVGSRVVPLIEQLADQERIVQTLVRETAAQAVSYREISTLFTEAPELTVPETRLRELATEISREAEGGASIAAAEVIASPEINERLEKSVPKICRELSSQAIEVSPEQARKLLVSELQQRAKGIFVRSAPKNIERGVNREARSAVWEASRAVKPALYDVARKQDGSALGLTRSQAEALREALKVVAASKLEACPFSAQEVALAKETAVRIVTTSPVVQSALETRAEQMADLSGQSVGQALMKLSESLEDRVETMVSEQAPVRQEGVGKDQGVQRSEPIQARTMPAAGQAMSLGPNYLSAIADLVATIAQGMGREHARSAASRRRSVAQEQRELQLPQEQERSR